MRARWNRFLTYEIWPFAAAVGMSAAVLFLVWNFFHPKPEPILYVAVFDVTLPAEEADRMCAALAGENAERITLDDSFRSDNVKDVERLQVLLYNHDVDAVIASEEVIRTLAGYGYFQEITEVLSEDAAEEAFSEGRLFETAGYLDTEEISMEDHETGRGEVLPYGLRLAGSTRWRELAGETASGYLAAVICESEHVEKASDLMSWLLDSGDA
ncbi:MAG: hypothetical protein J6D46_06535 [Lachnospiraceae bacterium]|nr:hypothetical protein [Lachnospiraceae bacterium]